MIDKFVKRFLKRKEELEDYFSNSHPSDYKDIVKQVISILNTDDYDEPPDPERIHEIDDGDYQGTLLYVIAAAGYQPSDYWYVKVSYGSCSGCDSLKRINELSDLDKKPTKQQTEDYMTLALHIVQGLKIMGDTEITNR